ncbi:hypothetical protein [Dolichospermum circinale]|uniref:hypothetical protein n=1 Tax=Dolichospermum circinale TaxID=109265 RepID=UPI00232C57BA|nr:hypothetical protein [Dolichospermum circinale]MDB9466435.1 hypothetical protein [Dolichospermum circinale CS-539/09]MDB9470443.1 hypothetical protein [Dolichospermum circinale CS-539]
MNTGWIKPFQRILSNRLPIIKWVVALVLIVSLTSCVESVSSKEPSIQPQVKAPPASEISGTFSETAPPDVIQALRPSLESYQPQVSILSPQIDEVLQENTVNVRLQVKDLPIFKDPQWQLGPHLHLILDNEPYIAVYDLNQSVVLPNLSPGTHTLRVFASRPWHESFKNEGAYAQTTFHILTKTEENNPDAKLPLLTYSRPNGNYGAEPIMLDFYLTNAPLHSVAETNPDDMMSNWRIRSTINGESFILDRWQPIYLKGFKPGKTWVKLEFLNNQGQPVKNAFNTTIRLINYQPNSQDTLSKIVRGELTADEVRGIVDQNYTVKTPVAKPSFTETPVPKTEKQSIPEVKPADVTETPVPKTEKQSIPEVKPADVTETPAPKTEQQSIPEVKPAEVTETPAPKTEQQSITEVKPAKVTETPASKTEQQSITEVKPADVTEIPASKTEQQSEVTKSLESNPNQLDTDSVPQTMGNIKSQLKE